MTAMNAGLSALWGSQSGLTWRVTVLVPVLLLVSCGGTVPSATGRATPSLAGAQPALASAPLNCRLPVAGFVEPTKQASQNGAVETQRGTGGFVDFPGATYTPAADSDASYLAAARVWLPVPPQWIAPDGKSYVEPRAPRQSPGPPTTTLFVVDVHTKVERLLFAAPQGDGAFVLAYTSSAIYVEVGSSTAAGNLELLRIDPSTGQHIPVAGARATTGGYQAWMAVNAGAAWGMVVTGNAQTPVYKLVSLSLVDGTKTDWYETPSAFTLAGFDWNDKPILQTSFDPAGAQLISIATPKKALPIETTGGAYVPGRGPSIKDAHGVWFGSGDGSIWLLKAEGQLTKVAAIPPQPGGTGQQFDPHAWRTIAGPCV